MKQNKKDRVIARGDQLDVISAKAEMLEDDAHAFNNKARKTKNAVCSQNIKLGIIIAVIVIGIIAVSRFIVVLSFYLPFFFFLSHHAFFFHPFLPTKNQITIRAVHHHRPYHYHLRRSKMRKISVKGRSITSIIFMKQKKLCAILFYFLLV